MLEMSRGNEPSRAAEGGMKMKRTIYLRAIERSVSLGQYVEAVKKAKANPDRRGKRFTDNVKEEKAKARARLFADLPRAFPFLQPVEGSGKSAHAMGAKNLKTHLGRRYRGVKFSVTSSTFTGGDAINISWTDGPLTADVKTIAGKYEEGSFNGMDDRYTYNGSIFPKVFGGAKYVMCQRDSSGEAIKKVAKKLGYEVELDKWNCMSNVEQGIRQTIMREVWATDCYRKE